MTRPTTSYAKAVFPAVQAVAAKLARDGLDLSQARIHRRPVLGGLISEYERAA